jgi:hypothetical protein
MDNDKYTIGKEISDLISTKLKEEQERWLRGGNGTCLYNLGVEFVQEVLGRYIKEHGPVGDDEEKELIFSFSKGFVEEQRKLAFK